VLSVTTHIVLLLLLQARGSRATRFVARFANAFHVHALSSEYGTAD
jgi:hypothetical protein